MQYIGKIVAAHGIKGEVVIAHDVVPPLQLEHWDCLRIEINPNSFIPYFIEHIEETTEGECICKFEEILHREATHPILNKRVYSSVNFQVKTKVDLGYAQFIGFTIQDKEKTIGRIEDVLEGAAQVLFKLQVNDKEILIPAVKEFIQSIDQKNNIIRMHLPDGLLDL